MVKFPASSGTFTEVQVTDDTSLKITGSVRTFLGKSRIEAIKKVLGKY